MTLALLPVLLLLVLSPFCDCWVNIGNHDDKAEQNLRNHPNQAPNPNPSPSSESNSTCFSSVDANPSSGRNQIRSDLAVELLAQVGWGWVTLDWTGLDWIGSNREIGFTNH